jgi:hypothetical protein
MHTKTIRVTLQKNEHAIEEEIEIRVLDILAVCEEWDWRQDRREDGSLGPKRQVYLGTKIGSRNHMGWIVKERATQVENLIDQAAKRNKHYLGECSAECCSRPWNEVRKKRSA